MKKKAAKKEMDDEIWVEFKVICVLCKVCGLHDSINCGDEHSVESDNLGRCYGWALYPS